MSRLTDEELRVLRWHDTLIGGVRVGDIATEALERGKERDALNAERERLEGLLGFAEGAVKTNHDRAETAEARVSELEEALRRVHTHYYEPVYGGYCWCRGYRTTGIDPHEPQCTAARAILADQGTARMEDE